MTELINIREFKRRVWGENGTPPTDLTIRNHLINSTFPGKKIGKIWYVDWTVYNSMTGRSLVDNVLVRMAS